MVILFMDFLFWTDVKLLLLCIVNLTKVKNKDWIPYSKDLVLL